MSNPTYFVAETAGYGLSIFVRYSQYNNGYSGYGEEKAAIEAATKRAQSENRAFSVIKIVAEVSPEPILPKVSVSRT